MNYIIKEAHIVRNRCYSALFTPIEVGSGYYARVPDLPGCITTDSILQNSIDQITDAASVWLIVAEDESLEIVSPTPQSEILLWNTTI